MAGFAAYVFEGEDPLLLSFEDPEDMAKKQKWLKEEIESTLEAGDDSACRGEKIPSKRKKNPRTLFVAKGPTCAEKSCRQGCLPPLIIGK